jgi:hypothetical protein
MLRSTRLSADLREDVYSPQFRTNATLQFNEMFSQWRSVRLQADVDGRLKPAARGMLKQP